MTDSRRSRHYRFLTAATLLLVAGASATTTIPQGATELRTIFSPKPSANGRAVVFSSLGDIWTADAATGEATRVVQHPAQENYPAFTPDGERILFCSDRTGSYQLYSVPRQGGEMLRHTFHSEGGILECVSPDGSSAIVRGPRHACNPRPDRLLMVDLTRESRERIVFDAPAHSASWSPDGKSLLFCQGGEPFYRKGYRGARSATIWRFDFAERAFTLKVRDETESLWPLWMPDGSGFYHVSGRGGTFNLWLARPTTPARQITSHTDDGVVTPSISADGSTIIYRSGFDVWILDTATPDKPRLFKPWTRTALPDVTTETRTIKGCDSVDIAPSGNAVFSAAGELWSMAGPDATPIRLTRSPAAEESPVFSPDGSWLYFLRDDGLEPNYHRARLSGQSLTEVHPVTSGTASKRFFRPSPDGSGISWIEGNTKVWVADADGSNPRMVLDGWQSPTFEWSPDGRWLAIAAEDPHSNRDILLVPASGKGQPLNLTRHPAFEGYPRWSPDGRTLVFSARRNPSAETEFWKISFGKGTPPDSLTQDQAAKLGEHATVVSTKGIEPIRTVWSADSKHLLFHSRKSGNTKLYSLNLETNDLSVISDKRGVPIRTTADGSLIRRVNRMPEILTPDGSSVYPIEVTVDRPLRDVLEVGFRRIWRTIGERFYDPAMHGLDWQALRLKYEPRAVLSRDSREFYRTTRQLLGELNASHTAFHRNPWPGEFSPPKIKSPTAHPGLIFDDTLPPDAPLVITRVVPGSPVAKLPNAPQSGDIVTRIAGEPVNSGTPLHKFLDGASGRGLPTTIRDSSGQERVIDLRPISYAKARGLDRTRRENLSRQRVTTANPLAAYLVVPDMQRTTYDKLAIEIFRESLRAEALILDFRGNGGGREADRMLGLLTQPAHSVTVPRDGVPGYPIDRRPAPAWNKPVVVLCNEDTYSNAEIFCHAVQQTGRAPLVGTATAGGVISAVTTTIPDVGKVQVPFRGWFRADNQRNLDLNGAQPDHRVFLTPDDQVRDSDPQLQMAIDILTKQR